MRLLRGVVGHPLAPATPTSTNSTLLKFMRMLASVYTNHDPQPSNPNQVMVIMLSAELGAVDEPHRHLKSFMKGRRLLKFT